MPAVAGVALAAAASQAITLGAASGFAALATSAAVGSIVAAGAVAAAGAGLSSLLAPKPKTFAPDASIRQPTPLFLPDVYGECRVGGVANVWKESSDQKGRDLITGWVIAGHRIEDVLEIWDGDRRIWSLAGGLDADYTDRVILAVRLGGPAPSTPTDMLAGLDGKIDSTFKVTGRAWCYIRFRNVKKKWPDGLPQKLWFRVRGARVFDPRSGLTAWSANWALCFRDWLIRRGGIPAARFSDAEVSAAANICDEGVSIAGGGTIPRYEMNGAFASDVIPREALGEWLRQGGNLRGLVNAGDRLVIQPGAYSAPVADFAEDDFLAPLKVTAETLVEEKWEGVRGTFRPQGGGARFQAEQFKTVIFDDYSGAPEDARLLELDFARETKWQRASRLALLALRQTRRLRKVAASVPFSALNAALLPGHRVTLALAAIGLSGVFEIIESRAVFDPDGPRVEIVALEDAPSFWGWVEGAATEPPESLSSTLPDPFFSPPPVNVTVTAARRVEPDGTVTRWLDVAWEEPAAGLLYFDRYEVEWTQGGRTFSARTTALEFQIFGLSATAGATVLVYSVNTLGIRSVGGGPGSVTPAGDVTPPAIPTSGAIFPIAGGFRFVIGTPADRDLAALRLYEGASGAAFGATLAILDVAAPPGAADVSFVRLGLPSGVTRRYFVSAIDRSGNESGAFGPLEATTPTSLSPEEIDAAIAAAEAAAAEALDQAGIAVAATDAFAGDLAAETAQRIAAIADETTARAAADQVVRARLSRPNMIVTDQFDAGVGLWTATGDYTVSVAAFRPPGFVDGLNLAIDVVNSGAGTVDESEWREGNLAGRTLRISGWGFSRSNEDRTLRFGLRLLLPDGVTESTAFSRATVRAAGTGSWGFFSIDVTINFATRAFKGSINSVGAAAGRVAIFAPRVEDVTGLAAAEASVSAVQTAFTNFEGEATAFDILTVTAGNSVARRTIGALPNNSFMKFDANLVIFASDKFQVRNPSNGETKAIFTVEGGQVVIDGDLVLKGESIGPGRLANGAVSYWFAGGGSALNVTMTNVVMPRGGSVTVWARRKVTLSQTVAQSGALHCDFSLLIDGVVRHTERFSISSDSSTAKTETFTFFLLGNASFAGAGTRAVRLETVKTGTGTLAKEDWRAAVVGSWA